MLKTSEFGEPYVVCPICCGRCVTDNRHKCWCCAGKGTTNRERALRLTTTWPPTRPVEEGE